MEGADLHRRTVAGDELPAGLVGDTGHHPRRRSDAALLDPNSARVGSPTIFASLAPWVGSRSAKSGRRKVTCSISRSKTANDACKRRMAKLLPTFNTKWPEKLTITTEWRRLHEGGLDDIREWHAQTKEAGGRPIVVVIDVLAKVRKPAGNKHLYDADYEATGVLAHLAHELGVAIVAIHHTRKMAADDLMEMVCGSFGTTGVADTVLILANKAGGMVLDIRGAGRGVGREGGRVQQGYVPMANPGDSAKIVSPSSGRRSSPRSRRSANR